MNAFSETTRVLNFSVGQQVTTGVSSARTSNPIDSNEVVLHASKKMYINVGGSSVEATTGGTSLPLEEDEKYHLRIMPGQYVAAIQATEAGILTVIPVKV